MALIKFGGGLTAMSGSIGGTTFARSGAGAYARSWAKPVNPNTASQQARRSTLNMLTHYWASELDDAQRQDWADWAAATVWKNKLGDTIQVPAISAFICINGTRIAAGHTLNENKPALPGWAATPTFTFTADTALDKLNLAEPGVPYDKADPAQLLFFWQHAMTGLGRIRVPEQARFLIKISNTPTPPVFPLATDPVFSISVDQIATVRLVLFDQYGRISAPGYARAVAAPLA
jgi:hypothetical protein